MTKITSKHKKCKMYSENKVYGLGCLTEIVQNFERRIEKLESQSKSKEYRK